jgi:hypothetical protein
MPRLITSADTIQIGLRLPRALHGQLEQVAVAHESSVSGAARHLIRRGLRAVDDELSARRSTPTDTSTQV